jgi:nucleoside-diphosphate-sugar epimerase
MPLKKIKVLVTGAAGNVGRHTALDLMAHGHSVRCVDIRPPKVKGATRNLVVDLRDLEGMTKAAKGLDAICHLGAIPHGGGGRAQWPEIWQINMVGTYHVLEAAERNGIGKVALASSICATGWCNFGSPPYKIQYLPIDEEHPGFPLDAYSLSKLINENTAQAFHYSFAMQTVCFRIANVGNVDVQGKKTLCTGGLGLLWTRVDVTDVAQCFRLGVEKSGLGFAYYHASSYWRYDENGEIVTAERTLKEVEAVQKNHPNLRVHPDLFKGRNSFSCDKAIKELGYKPKY